MTVRNLSQRPKPSSTALLAKQCLEDSERWFGDSINWKTVRGLVHHTLALGGEVGEVQNIIKKIDRGSLSITDATVRHDLAMELADVYIYLLNIAGLLGIDLEKLYVQKRIINEQRFIQQRKAREAREADAGDE